MTIAEYIASEAIESFKGGVVDSSTDTSHPLVVLNPKSFKMELQQGIKAQLVIACTSSVTASVEVSLAEGVVLDIVELYAADSIVKVTVHQAESSALSTFSALLSSSHVSYTHALEGRGATNRFNALFVATGAEHQTIELNTRHLVPDCSSNSLIKGIAAGRATGEFRGLVYVAPDAQRTDAQQQNRNIQLDNAQIVALPQLEIYADDVRCSHGSTVGYEDAEVLYYMRQRGIDAATARRLQVEGFVQEVVMRCNMEPLCGIVREAVSDKMSQI
ncbi:MAG: SufD family Fe-S cluster assembly protein [Alistipes sp.]|nr:SufD family Fe-S cluster assembly protein [Alistipes sp.]